MIPFISYSKKEKEIAKKKKKKKKKKQIGGCWGMGMEEEVDYQKHKGTFWGSIF